MIDEIRPVRERPSVLSLILYGLLAWLCAMLQVGFFNRLPLLGATLPLLLAVTVRVAWRRGEVTGAIFAAVGGVVLDALTSPALSLSPLFLVPVAIYAGWAAKRLFDHPLTLLLVTLPPCAVASVLRGVRDGSVKIALATLLGGLLVTAALLIPSTLKRIRKR